MVGISSGIRSQGGVQGGDPRFQNSTVGVKCFFLFFDYLSIKQKIILNSHNGSRVRLYWLFSSGICCAFALILGRVIVWGVERQCS